MNQRTNPVNMIPNKPIDNKQKSIDKSNKESKKVSIIRTEESTRQGIRWRSKINNNFIVYMHIRPDINEPYSLKLGLKYCF